MDTKRSESTPPSDTEPVHESETMLEEMIDISLQPDRAHHDELGRTSEGTEEAASPREQPAAPLDIEEVDE